MREFSTKSNGGNFRNATKLEAFLKALVESKKK
jgi:hypothetical protein